MCTGVADTGLEPAPNLSPELDLELEPATDPAFDPPLHPPLAPAPPILLPLPPPPPPAALATVRYANRERVASLRHWSRIHVFGRSYERDFCQPR